MFFNVLMLLSEPLLGNVAFLTGCRDSPVSEKQEEKTQLESSRTRNGYVIKINSLLLTYGKK